MIVKNCNSQPKLHGPIKDAAHFRWHEVKKTERYCAFVDALTQSMQVKDEPLAYGEDKP